MTRPADGSGAATVFDEIRLICFDLDDTLWPCAPVIHAAEQDCYAWLQQHAPRLTQRHSQDALRTHRLDLARRQPHIAHDLTELRRRSLATLLEAEGYVEALANLANDVFRRARNRVCPYDDVVDGLTRLRAHYTLASVTNGNSQIESTPLHASFDYSLTAAEVGAAKPDPAMFHAVSRRSGIPLQQIVHVGDDPQRDITAARTIGLATVWVNRDGRDWPQDLTPADLEVDGLAGLVERLLG